MTYLVKKFLLIMVGIPSVGKTTLAKTLAKKFEENGFPTIVIGSDDIRNMIPGYSENFKPDREPLIRGITLNLIGNCLELGLNVINDDLNYYKSMRHYLLELANSKDYHYEMIFIKAPLDKAIEWNEKRGLPIPNSVIEEVYNKLDEPGEYSWDVPLITLESINLEDEEIINLIYSKLISEIEKPIEQPTQYTKSKPGKSESFDKVTRQLIGEIVNKQDHKKFNKKLSLIRKQFLSKAKKENFSLEELKQKFSKEIRDFIKAHQGEL